MREREIRKRVETALEEFLSNESELLERNAGERAIAGILATYLATRFRTGAQDT
jgi:hypothetical protein